jgi:MFS family permease
MTEADAKGEFARGWRVLLAAALGIALGVSSLYFYSLGIFIKPLAATFGWSRAQSALGATVGTLCAAVMAVPSGRLVDRLGSVRVGLGSLVLLAIGFAALGTVTAGLNSFLVVTALLSLATAGSSPVSFSRMIVATFERHRGIALGLTLSGTGLGAVLIPAVLTPFVAAHGWRAGYRALAAVIVLCLPVLALLLRTTPGDARERAPLRPFGEVIGNPAFGVLGTMFASASIAILGTVVHFVPMLTDAGLSPAGAGRVAALIGLAAIVSRLISGWLLDRLPGTWVAAGLFMLAALGLVVMGAGGPILFVPGALIVGLAIGAEVDLLAFLTGRYFSRAGYGQAYGALYALFLLGGALGPALAGAMHDLTDSYRPWLLLAGALLGLSAGLAFVLGRIAGHGAMHRLS